MLGPPKGAFNLKLEVLSTSQAGAHDHQKDQGVDSNFWSLLAIGMVVVQASENTLVYWLWKFSIFSVCTASSSYIYTILAMGVQIRFTQRSSNCRIEEFWTHRRGIEKVPQGHHNGFLGDTILVMSSGWKAPHETNADWVESISLTFSSWSKAKFNRVLFQTFLIYDPFCCWFFSSCLEDHHLVLLKRDSYLTGLPCFNQQL